MSPRRTRTLPSSASGAAPEVEAIRQRVLVLARSEDPAPVDRGLKRSRRLELESEPGLKRRLLEKKVGTARLPTSDSAVSQIVPVKSQKLEDEGIESGSTSSEFGVERTAGRERGLRKRPRRGLRTFVDSRMGPRAGCHSLLEEAAVSTKVRATYSKRLKELWDVEVDDALVKMFNHLFKEGEGSSTGDYILAALIDRFPQFGKLGSRKIPRSMAGSARLEKVVPISLAACLPPRDLVRHQLEDGRSRAFGKGSLQPPPGLDLPSARSSVEASQDGPGAADKGCDWQLVSGDKFERNRRCVQDWHEGRFSAGGLELAPVRGATFPGTVEREADGSGLGIRLQPVSLCLSRLLFGPEVELGAVPGQAFGSFNRPLHECANTGGSSKERGLAVPTVGCPLREVGSPRSYLAGPQPISAAGMPIRRKIHRGDHARPRLSGHTSPWPVKKGASFGVFTGSGRVAGAARKLGFQTREWEPRLIADTRALFKVQADIRAGLLLGAIVVPPALTFSVACDREGMLRTRFEPWGCQTLSGTNWEKVKDDNACMWSAIRLILFLHAAHLPWVFSQPCSSKVWYLPELIRLQGLDSVQVVQTDSCQWNVPWRRRLQILIGNVSTDDADCCRRLCYGQHGMRSSSSRPHAVIKGSSGLKLAQSYPHPLAHRLAKLILARYMVVPS